MKRKAIVFAVILFLLTFTPQCKRSYVTITGLEMDFKERVSSSPYQMQPIADGWDKDLFILYQEIWTSGKIAQMLNQICLASLCMAAFDPDDPTPWNELLTETFELRFDTDLLYDGNRIPARTDLLSYKGLSEAIVRDYRGFEFPEALFTLISFEKETFAVTLSCETSNEKVLSVTKEARVNPRKLIAQ